MNFIFNELLLKFVFGGTLVVCVSLLGRSEHPQLAGLAVLFPAVTVAGYYCLLSSEGAEAVRPAILFSILSVPAVAVFLVVLYFAAGKFSTWQSIFLSVCSWLATATVILLADRYFFGFTGK